MTNKFLLWAMVLLQIFFICCFWLLQMASNSINEHDNNNNNNNNGDTDEIFNTKIDNFNQNALTSNLWLQQRQQRSTSIFSTITTSTTTTTTTYNERVNFIIRKNALKTKTTKYPTQNIHFGVTTKMKSLTNVNNFLKDFFLKKPTNRLNSNESATTTTTTTATTTELELKNVWCYREGTINETQQREETVALSWNWETEQTQPKCKCQKGWHGTDCGQPEIIWRALMTTSKLPFQLLQPTPNGSVRHLFYFLEGNFFNFDFLELQIQMLAEIVDYFIIFHRNDKKVTNTEFKLLQRKLHEIFDNKSNNYFIYSCSQNYLTKSTAKIIDNNNKENNNCTIASAYAELKRQISNEQKPLPTDLLLYTDEHVLIQAAILKFLKYYTTNVYLLRLRLKYNVYGFYWQHPMQTHLDGLISSFKYLDDWQLGAGNLKQLMRIATSASASGGSAGVGGNGRLPFIIGDLNHFAGWYCHYCLQPDEIIMELQANALVVDDATRKTHKNEVQFPKMPRNRQIDALYLQKLIAQGVYIDGVTQLERMRRYTDKYYAPNYVETFNWKFNHLLVNLYESLDDYDIVIGDGIY